LPNEANIIARDHAGRFLFGKRKAGYQKIKKDRLEFYSRLIGQSLSLNTDP